MELLITGILVKRFFLLKESAESVKFFPTPLKKAPTPDSEALRKTDVMCVTSLIWNDPTD